MKVTALDKPVPVPPPPFVRIELTQDEADQLLTILGKGNFLVGNLFDALHGAGAKYNNYTATCRYNCQTVDLSGIRLKKVTD